MTDLLLAEAPAGRHIAQFHRESESLIASVHAFIEGGIRRGHVVVVIAGSESSESVLARLSGANLHPQALRDSGQLMLVDAAGLMKGFMADGTPEWARFRFAMADILDRARAFGHGTRIYCEIADLLWRDGNTAGAIGVEGLWNRLAGAYSFSLYCGFVLDTQSEKSYAGPLEDLALAYTDIVGAPDDERFEVALDRASKEIFGISLSQMAGMTKLDGARRFPSGQRTMLWVYRHLPLSSPQLAERARRYFKEAIPPPRRAP